MKALTAELDAATDALEAAHARCEETGRALHQAETDDLEARQARSDALDRLARAKAAMLAALTAPPPESNDHLSTCEAKQEGDACLCHGEGDVVLNPHGPSVANPYELTVMEGRGAYEQCFPTEQAARDAMQCAVECEGADFAYVIFERRRIAELAKTHTAHLPAPPIAIPEGFTRWDGGAHCPVSGETRVEVILTDGDRMTDYALSELFVWRYPGFTTSVIAYRIVEAPADPDRAQDAGEGQKGPDNAKAWLEGSQCALDGKARDASHMRDDLRADWLSGYDYRMAHDPPDADIADAEASVEDEPDASIASNLQEVQITPDLGEASAAADPDARTTFTTEGAEFRARLEERIGNAGKPIEAYAPTARVWDDDSNRAVTVDPFFKDYNPQPELKPDAFAIDPAEVTPPKRFSIGKLFGSKEREPA